MKIHIKEKINRYADMLVKEKQNYFNCFIPGHIGFVATKALRLFYSGITLNRQQAEFLNEINKRGHIIYVSKYKSYFEFMFCYSRYKDEKLPFPEIGIDYKSYIWQPVSRFCKILTSRIVYLIKNKKFPSPYETNYVGEELSKGRCAFLSLLERKGLRRRFIKSQKDPVRYLIEFQKTTDKPVYLVPQWMFFSKRAQNPHRSLFEVLFGTEENPGIMRRFMLLFQKPQNVFVEISEPFNLLRFIQDPENKNSSIDHLVFLVRKELTNRLNRHRQSIVGPVLKSRTEIMDIVLRNERLQKMMKDYANSHDKPLSVVYKRAHGYLDEIASNFNYNAVQIFSWPLTWMTKNMFEGYEVNIDVLNRVKLASQKAPLIFAPCHKSHIDYLIISYILYHNNMPCPLIAAGKNLSFWPLGPIFRGGGAFFLRRTFRGALMYSKVFAEYVKTILKEGFNIEFFIEGGRSRTGKLNLAKLGLLSIILDAYKNGACPDLYFVPVYIGYDRILEEKAYLSELEGNAKITENLSQIIKARKFLKKRYGRIYVQFNEPMSLKEILSNYEIPFEEMSKEGNSALCRNIGHRIINAINDVSVVTPHALVACALLNCSTKGFLKGEFISIVETYLNFLVFQNAKLSDTMGNYVHAVEQALESYLNRKILEKMEITNVREALGDTKFKVFENKRPTLDYYKNNCISFFIPASYTALSIIVQDAFQFSEMNLYPHYEFLQEFFKDEFAYDVDKTTSDYINNVLNAFINEAIIIPHPELTDVYNITSAGFRKLSYFAMFLKTFFESYYIAFNVFMEHERQDLKGKDSLKKMQNLGSLMYKRLEVERKESLSKINFKNAVNYFNTHGIKGKENKEELEFYNKKIQKYIRCLNSI